MTRQTKLQIGLDIKPLREDTKKAKQAIEELGRVKIDRGLRSQIKDLFGKQLRDDVIRYRSELERVRGEMRNISLTDPFGTQRVQAYLRTVDQLNRGLQQTQRLQRSMGTFGGMGGGGGSGPSGMPNFSRMPGSGLVRGLTSTAGAIGVGVGIAASVSRQADLGRAGLGVRSLTGGNSVSGNSDYGFLQSERLERARAIAATAGRNMSPEAITKEVNRSEMFERAFGISGEEFAGARGAARKAGVGDPGKFVANTIGDAVALKLEGSAIGEYLSSMTDYLASVSKGVTVNQTSLRGFAAALGSLDFFRQDPARIFDTIQQLEAIFKGGGNEYQQFGTYQSIQEAAFAQNGRGLTPAGADVRQMIGLFGGGKEQAAKLRKAGMGDLADVVGIGGDKIMKAGMEREFRTAMKASGGDNQLAAQMFMRNTGLKNQGGLEIFAGMAANGGKMNTAGLGALKKAMRSPEEVAEQNMRNFDGSVTKFAQRIDDLQNTVSRFITEGTLKFVDAVDDFSKATGMLESDVEKLAAAVIAFTAAKGIANTLGGGEGFGGKGGMMLFGGMTAAAVGYEIGTAIRKQLNEWTDGEWDEKVDSFWRKILGIDEAEAKNDAVNQAIMDHGADWIQEAKKRGLPTDPDSVNRMADIYTGSEKRRQMRIDQADYDEKRGLKVDRSQLDMTPMTPEEVMDEMTRKKSGLEKVEEFLGLKADGGVIGLAGGGSVPEYNPPEDREARRKYNAWYNAQVEAARLGKEPEKSMDMAASITAFARSKLGHAHGGTVGVSSINGWSRGGSMGRDNIDAKMMGGEFVVNARDASANMMALVHANAGGRIVPAADGGYFGDADDISYSEGGAMPGGIDIGALQLALGGNVEATNMLTKTITQLAAGGGIIKGHPRGSGGTRYGRA